MLLLRQNDAYDDDADTAGALEIKRDFGLHYKSRHIVSQERKHFVSETARAANSPSFEDLLVDVGRNKNKDAFIALFDYFAPRLKSFLMRGGLGPDQAEELAQETLLAVWHKAGNFDPSKASASTWMYTIARNKKIDFFRKNDRPDPDPNDPYFKLNEETSQIDGLSFVQEADVISDAMKDLPDEQADLVKMAFFEDKTHQEISETTDIPLGTVKSRIRLALKKLESALEGKIEIE